MNACPLRVARAPISAQTPKPALALRAVQGGAGGSLSHRWLGGSVCLCRGSVGREGAETLLPRPPATLRMLGGLGGLGGLCSGPSSLLLPGVSVMPARRQLLVMFPG